MFPLAGHHDLQPFFRESARRQLGFFHMGTRCVQQHFPLPFRFRIHRRPHAMGADHDRCRASRRQFIHYVHALRPQFFDHLGVMNQRSQRKHRRTGLSRRRRRHFHGPPHAIAESHVFRRQYFHGCLPTESSCLL